MISPQYKPGQQVVLNIQSPPWSRSVHVIITAEPVYKKVSFWGKVKSMIGLQRVSKEIIDFKYRCKSPAGMKDFLQSELKIYIPDTVKPHSNQ